MSCEDKLNSNIINKVYNDIKIFGEEKINVMEQVMGLESKRQDILNMIDFKINNKDEIKTFVENMPITIVRIVENNKVEKPQQRKKRKCQHNNRGFCRFRKKCLNIHAVEICENFQNNEKCLTQG